MCWPYCIPVSGDRPPTSDNDGPHDGAIVVMVTIHRIMPIYHTPHHQRFISTHVECPEHRFYVPIFRKFSATLWSERGRGGGGGERGRGEGGGGIAGVAGISHTWCVTSKLKLILSQLLSRSMQKIYILYFFHPNLQCIGPGTICILNGQCIPVIFHQISAQFFKPIYINQYFVWNFSMELNFLLNTSLIFWVAIF